MTTTAADERVLNVGANQRLLPKQTITPHQARQQLARWSSDRTALGMIYARANHSANMWARVTVSAPNSGRLLCQNEQMHFMLSIDNAAFTIESLDCWDHSMPPSDRAAIEGLQIWCTDGDWLFLTEQIAASRTLSLSNPLKN
jgi:hypothetical protein